MSTAAAERGPERWAPWLNLVLPGGGLVLLGARWTGFYLALLFAACANFALAAVLLFPDDCGRPVQLLAIGAGAGGYVGAQWRCAQTARARRARIADVRRRTALREARRMVEQGAFNEALRVLSPVAQENPDDLLVAYRIAEVLTAAGTSHAARLAWQRVRALDRHGVYREQLRMCEARLDQAKLQRSKE